MYTHGPMRATCTILGIESSCDETSAAIVVDGRDVRSNLVSSQVDLHAKYGGVVPEIASRAHIERIQPIVAEAMEQDSGTKLTELRVDGGAAANDVLMQMQADILGREVVRPACLETTALGAAYLAGLATGFWKNREDVTNNWREERRFSPEMSEERREEMNSGWQRAVERAKGWATD